MNNKYFLIDEPCELYCTDSEDTMIMSFGDSADGTSCNIGTNDMCIGGICRVTINIYIINYI